MIKLRDKTWNSFPNRIGDAIINNKLKRLHEDNIKNSTNNYFDTIWIKIPYLGDKGHQLSKPLKKIEAPFY